MTRSVAIALACMASLLLVGCGRRAAPREPRQPRLSAERPARTAGSADAELVAQTLPEVLSGRAWTSREAFVVEDSLGGLTLLDPATGAVRARVQPPSPARVLGLSRDGRRLLATRWHWDLDSGELEALPWEQAPIACRLDLALCAFVVEPPRPDEPRVIELRSVETGELRRAIPARIGPCSDGDWVGDTILARQPWNQSVVIDLRVGRAVAWREGHLRLVAGGSRALQQSGPSTFRLIDPRTGSEHGTVAGLGAPSERDLPGSFWSLYTQGDTRAAVSHADGRVLRAFDANARCERFADVCLFRDASGWTRIDAFGRVTRRDAPPDTAPWEVRGLLSPRDAWVVQQESTVVLHASGARGAVQGPAPEAPRRIVQVTFAEGGAGLDVDLDGVIEGWRADGVERQASTLDALDGLAAGTRVLVANDDAVRLLAGERGVELVSVATQATTQIAGLAEVSCTRAWWLGPQRAVLSCFDHRDAPTTFVVDIAAAQSWTWTDGPVLEVARAADGSTAAILDRLGLAIVDPSTGQLTVRIELPLDSEPQSLAVAAGRVSLRTKDAWRSFSLDGSSLSSRPLDEHDALHPDGLVAARCAQGRVRLESRDEALELPKGPPCSRATRFAFDAPGRFVAAFDARTVYVVRVADGAWLALRVADENTAYVTAPDGRFDAPPDAPSLRYRLAGPLRTARMVPLEDVAAQRARGLLARFLAGE